ncbi:MAG: L,D-transpeptidase family protein [Proteobacteria bacterium]|nr:L,D-transpeptidase family protein [Pseudomonadota bacterium]
MKRWIKSANSAAFLALTLSLAVGQPAWAERPDENQSGPTVPVAPAGTATVAPALLHIPNLDASITELATDPLFDGLAVDWTGLLNFYAENGGLALFTTPTGLSPLGQQLYDRLPIAAAAGLQIPAVVMTAVANAPLPASPDNQGRAEALLAAAFVGTAVDANTYLGDADEHGALVMNKISDAQAKGEVGIKDLLDEQLPTYYRFWALANYLPKQVAFLEKGGWPEVPSVKKLEPGNSNPVVNAIRARLGVTGELAAADVVTGDVYDPKLVAAVELFQRNHGLNDDGVIGGRTIEELNVSAEERVRQILLNLERMRADGPSFQSRHLIANIPSQEVKVIQDGKVTFYTKAIFGKLERKSPTLSSVIHTVKLNPDWTAPAKIAAIDEVKRERSNPGFLEAKGFTIYDRSGNVVSPDAIDWHSVGPGNFPYTLRQAPGPENALGPVKLDFPNDHAVFIHGTPTVKLFDKQDRFFSSGCVRTQQPVELAKFVLKDDPEWPASRIDDVLKTAKTTLVKLKDPLPVHITYVTAWVDEDGVMQFRKDAYSYDDLPRLPRAIKQQLVAAAQQAEPAPALGEPDKDEGKGK